MSDPNNDRNIQPFKPQPLAGITGGSNVLPQLLSKLTEAEISQLKTKALEGQLALEFKRLNLQDRLNISQADLTLFEDHIRRMARETQGVGSSYKATGDFETASGRISVEAKKGCAGLIVVGAFLSGSLAGGLYILSRVV